MFSDCHWSRAYFFDFYQFTTLIVLVHELTFFFLHSDCNEDHGKTYFN